MYYDEQDVVVGAMAMSTQPSKYCFQYHNPSYLDPLDAEM